ncbi:MAG: GntR family transcriptional regulator [Verrucomicrobiota bacterium]
MPTSVTANPSPTRKTAANRAGVVRGVLEELIRGRWRGGDRLTEAEACNRFQVSRTPVREAIFELQGLGLLELKRNCGAIFLPFGPEELGHLYHVRAILETEAARLAAPLIRVETIERLHQQFRTIQQSGGVDPDWRHDRALHHAIAIASGNPRLSAEIERYGNLVQAIRQIVGETVIEIHTTTADEHLAIVEALQSRQANRSAEAMATHLQQAAESAMDSLERIQV